MAFTNCKVHMEFVDVTAGTEGEVSSSSYAELSELSLFQEEETNHPEYLYLDLNGAVLDGSLFIADTDSKFPYISSEQSDRDCSFSSVPSIIVDFSGIHTSSGLTLVFSRDWPETVRITWYQIDGTKLFSETYHPDQLRFYCKKQATYAKVVIEFLQTRLPMQRIQLAYIKYGMELDWDREKVKAATITHEVDGTYASLPIGTAEVSIVDEYNDFDLTNHDGMWASIQKNQTLTLTEELASKEVACGKYYIDTWSSSANIVAFSLVDILGLMDKTKFYGGRIYESETAGNIIDEIMTSAGIAKYKVNADVRNTIVSGYLGICSNREALQNVLFVCGAICNCMEGAIEIYKPGREVVSTINIARKFSTEVKIAEYVSGVSVTFYKYVEKLEKEEIYTGTLPPGKSIVCDRL